MVLAIVPKVKVIVIATLTVGISCGVECLWPRMGSVGLGFRMYDLGVQSSGFRVKGLGIRVSWFRMWGLEFRVLGFRVLGLWSRVEV